MKIMSIRWLAPIVFVAALPAGAAAQVAASAPAPPAAVLAPGAADAGSPAPAPAIAAVPMPAPAAAVSPSVMVAAAVEQTATPQPAQTPAPPEPAAPPARAQGERRAHQEIVEQRMAEAERRRSGATQSKGVNIRIDATVIESHGDQVMGRKVLTLTLVDSGGWGSVRSSQQVITHPKGAVPGMVNRRPAPLNMDARASLRDDGRIKVDVTLEYSAGAADSSGSQAQDDEGAVDNGIKQSVAVVLESGKPLLVAQSADAVGDRRVALELKATVLK